MTTVTLNVVLEEDAMLQVLCILEEAKADAVNDLETGFQGDPFFDKEDIDGAQQIIDSVDAIQAAVADQLDELLEQALYHHELARGARR